MSERFLVAIDGSGYGWKALDLAAMLAKHQSASIDVIHVVPFEKLSDEFVSWAELEGIPAHDIQARFEDSRAASSGILEEARERLADHDLEGFDIQVAMGNPADRIIECAKKTKASMVFLGSRGLSDFQGMLIGSISHKVSSLVPCTCVIVK